MQFKSKVNITEELTQPFINLIYPLVANQIKIPYPKPLKTQIPSTNKLELTNHKLCICIYVYYLYCFNC